MSTEATPETKQSKGRQIYQMRVDKIVDHTHRIRELFLSCEEPQQFKFRSGQFAMLHVPAQPKTLLRAYSMASDDRNENGFRLVFNYVDQGPASVFVWALKGGETLQFTGPFGRLFFKEPPTKQVLFLNTGSGVSQHVCYLASLGHKFPEVSFRLLFGVRNEQDIYYQDELTKLKSAFPNFSFDYVLSRPSTDWKGRKGYVQDHIAEFEYLKIPTTFYLCGNGSMIKDVKARLAEQSFDSSLVLAEAFD